MTDEPIDEAELEAETVAEVADALDVDETEAAELVASVDGTGPTTNGNENTNANGDGDGQLVASDGLATRQEFQMRFALAQALGDNLPSDEDYYEVFSWDKNPTVEDYFALALRNPIAYAVTFLECDIAWRNLPEIVDTADPPGGQDQTAFEAAIEELVDEHRVWHYARRAHKLAGIGKFGCLVIEFDDIDGPGELSQPVGDPDGLRGHKPFSRASIADVRVGGPGTDRWGEPIAYQLDFSDENETEGVIRQEGPEQVWVHHTRVIHIPSDELLDDEIRGVPRQKPVYNQLIDIERTLGAAGTLAYRAAAWGIHVNIDKDFELEDGGDELREHLERWQHGLENVLRTHGADEVKSLGGEDIDPSPITDVNFELISAQTGIPQSVLKGNETGERATTQDLKEWYGKIGGDQVEFLEPMIVREWVDRVLQYEIAPEPRGDGYDVEWDPLHERNEKDTAEIQQTRSQALQNLPELEMELTPAEQAEYLEDGTLPNDLAERVARRDELQNEMGALDDGHDADIADPGDDVVEIPADE